MMPLVYAGLFLAVAIWLIFQQIDDVYSVENGVTHPDDGAMHPGEHPHLWVGGDE